MSTSIVPFDQQLPAHLASMNDVSGDDLTAGAGGGFPVISIKGKVFHLSRGDDRQLITKPEAPDEPAASLEVVILKANRNLSKTYYPNGYEEGAQDKPTCYSNDGIAPGADALEPQSVKCVTCLHNQWGSRVSDNGKKTKSCSDVRRLAIAPVGQLNDPMLIRVPAASLSPLSQYGDLLKKRGVKYPQVSTKIGFDYTVAHPALTFKPVGFLTEDMLAQVTEVRESDIVNRIIGMDGVQRDVQPEPTPVKVAPALAQVAAPKPAPAVVKPTEPAKQPATEKPVVKASAFSTAPVKPAEPAKPAAVKPAAATKTVQASKLVEVNTDNLEAELDKVLSGAGFDDVTAETADA